MRETERDGGIEGEKARRDGHADTDERTDGHADTDERMARGRNWFSFRETGNICCEQIFASENLCTHKGPESHDLKKNCLYTEGFFPPFLHVVL